MLAAPRIDLTIALVSTVIAFTLGVGLGVISGYFTQDHRFGRYAGALIIRLADIVQAFPMFVFALALVGISGPSARNVILALAFLNIPFFLRLTRGAVMQVRSRTFVEAALCAGNTRAAHGLQARHAELAWPPQWSISPPRSASRSCSRRA